MMDVKEKEKKGVSKGEKQEQIREKTRPKK